MTAWLDMGKMDDLGRMDTPMHRIDARAKAVTTMLFILAVMSFPRYEMTALTPFFFYPLALLRFGRIPFSVIGKKLLVALPFALLIGLFNPLLDRQPMAIGSHEIAGGWLSFFSIVLRFLLTAGTALILVACTGMNRLCAGMEQLGVPRLFAVQLLFLHRYLFVIADEATRMLRSLRLRSAGSGAPSLSIYGSLTGHLLLRSMDRADRIYQAMASRGFDGSIRFLQRDRFRLTDALFILGWTLFFAIARCWNLADSLGLLLTGAHP